MEKCTVAELAELFNLTERRIYQLVEEKIIPKESKGRYDLKSVLQAYNKYLQDLAANRSSSVEQKDFKSRLLKAQAEKAELELAVYKGKYIDANEVEFVWSGLVLAFRSKMLGLPSKLARSLAAAGSEIVQIHKILEDEIRDALTELSKYEHDEESDSKHCQQQSSAASATQGK